MERIKKALITLGIVLIFPLLIELIFRDVKWYILVFPYFSYLLFLTVKATNMANDMSRRRWNNMFFVVFYAGLIFTVILNALELESDLVRLSFGIVNGFVVIFSLLGFILMTANVLSIDRSFSNVLKTMFWMALFPIGLLILEKNLDDKTREANY
jgi:hypothetical protein